MHLTTLVSVSISVSLSFGLINIPDHCLFVMLMCGFDARFTELLITNIAIVFFAHEQKLLHVRLFCEYK